MDKDKPEEKKLDRRKITMPQNSQGGKVSITHGGYSFLRCGVVPCDRCLFKSDSCPSYRPGGDCEIIKAYQEQKIKEVMSLPWVRPHHIDRVEAYVRIRCFLLVIDKWLSKTGVFVKGSEDENTKEGRRGLDIQPVLKFYFVALNAQERIAEKLGLSPLAEKMLGIDSGAEETLQDHLDKMQEIKPEDGSKDEKAEG